MAIGAFVCRHQRQAHRDDNQSFFAYHNSCRAVWGRGGSSAGRNVECNDLSVHGTVRVLWARTFIATEAFVYRHEGLISWRLAADSRHEYGMSRRERSSHQDIVRCPQSAVHRVAARGSIGMSLAIQAFVCWHENLIITTCGCAVPAIIIDVHPSFLSQTLDVRCLPKIAQGDKVIVS